MKKILLAALLCVLLIVTVVPVSAAYTGGMLSPALAVISQQNVMVKSGLISGNITFSKDDFEKAVGGKIEYITVTSLPLHSEGILTYNGTEVCVNQTINAASLSCLKFIPTGSSKTGSFRFKSTGEYSTECILKYTDSLNIAPSSAEKEDDVSVWTQCDIETYGTLAGRDPDGDHIVFEITDYPEKGILELLDCEAGTYTYTPCDGILGKDEFSYVVCDEWGHYSPESTVVIDIEKAASDIVFNDMDGHWAHNAAIVMAGENIMDFEFDETGVMFNPDDKITREDFLVGVMKVLGAGDIEPASTVFADDKEISEKASGYVERAYSLGIIKGNKRDGLIYFDPQSTITRSEAAVILNKIIGAPEYESVSVFSDDDAVPSWAKGSLYALTNEGVFKGTGEGRISPNETLDRAQTAQILLTIKKLYS